MIVRTGPVTDDDPQDKPSNFRVWLYDKPIDELKINQTRIKTRRLMGSKVVFLTEFGISDRMEITALRYVTQKQYYEKVCKQV